MMAARFIGGLAVGCSSIAAPVYIAEISPAENRGKLTALFQFNVIFGMCVSQFVNWALGGLGATAWRWMLGAEAVPALAFTLLCPFLVESPRWIEMKELGTGNGERTRGFWSRGNGRPILLALLVAFFNQLSGINTVLYFAKRVFMMAGASDSASLAIVGFFGVMMVLHLIWALTLVPETKGRPLEDIRL